MPEPTTVDAVIELHKAANEVEAMVELGVADNRAERRDRVAFLRALAADVEKYKTMHPIGSTRTPGSPLRRAYDMAHGALLARLRGTP